MTFSFVLLKSQCGVSEELGSCHDRQTYRPFEYCLANVLMSQKVYGRSNNFIIFYSSNFSSPGCAILK